MWLISSTIKDCMTGELTDSWCVHETEEEAKEYYDNLMTYDDIYSANISVITQSTEPHHVEGFWNDAELSFCKTTSYKPSFKILLLCG
jgi:hypothetical protein